MPWVVAYTWIGFGVMLIWWFSVLLPKMSTAAASSEQQGHMSEMMMSPIVKITVLLFSVVFTWPGLFAPILANVLKSGGPLDQLGAGTKRVAARELNSLRRWVMVSRLVMCLSVFTLGSLQMIVASVLHLMRSEIETDMSTMFEHGGDTMAWIMLAVAPGLAVCGGIGFASMAAFVGTLKVAVTLSRDDVIEVLKKTTTDALREDRVWSADVAFPAIRL